MQARNVVVKLSFKSPGSDGLGAKNAAHLRYIGTRPGVDTTVTDESLYRAAGRDLAADEDYARYIAERPGVARETGEGMALHGLFDATGAADFGAVRAEIRNLENSPVYRMIVSVTETTAELVGLDDKAAWEAFVCSEASEIARGLSIPLDRLRWVAALHPEAGHPHVHLLVWDGADRPRHRDVIEKSELVGMREALTRDLWRPVSEELAAEKAATRDGLVGTARAELERMSAILGWSAPVLSSDRAVTVPVRTAGELGRIQGGLERVASLLPGRGRVAYAYMPPETKAAVQAVVSDLLAHPEYRAVAERHVELAREYATRQTTSPARIEAAAARARGDLERRVAERVLQTAAGLEQSQLRERVWRAAPIVASRGVRSGLLPSVCEQAARACGAAGIPEGPVYTALADVHGDGVAIEDARAGGQESGRIRASDVSALERAGGGERTEPVMAGLAAAAHLAARAYRDMSRAQERTAGSGNPRNRARRRGKEHDIWRDAEPDTGRPER